jgi:hypothetical protein
MSLKVIKPTWERVATGSGIKMSRDGVLLLEFATSKGEREYDWEGKQNFALSATECAEVLEAVETGTAKNFFHDPNKMGIGEGSITKSLRVTPARETGWFFSLSVNQRDSGAIKFDTILSNAELRVIRTLMNVSYDGFGWMCCTCVFLYSRTRCSTNVLYWCPHSPICFCIFYKQLHQMRPSLPHTCTCSLLFRGCWDLTRYLLLRPPTCDSRRHRRKCLFVLGDGVLKATSRPSDVVLGLSFWNSMLFRLCRGRRFGPAPQED